MILTKFKFSTLTVVTLLTLSLNVFSTGVCTPEQNEFGGEFAEQEKMVEQVQSDIDEGNILSTNEEYTDIANDNINTLTDNSDLSISEVTGETMDEVASLTADATTDATTALVTEAGVSVGDVLGPIGLAVSAAFLMYNLVTVLDEKNASMVDVIGASIGWTSMWYGLYQSNVDKKKAIKEKRAFYAALYKTNYEQNYEISFAELQTADEILSRLDTTLEGMIAQDIKAVESIKLEFNKKLSTGLKLKYRHDINALQTHLKGFFAHQWVQASPIFLELIEFFKQSNNAVKFIDKVVQDEQWHRLSDTGRADSTRVIDLHKVTYIDGVSNDKKTLNLDTLTFKSSQLDNTWFVGSTADSKGNFAELVYYLVVTLRNTPNQDAGVQYRAQSIFAENKPVTLVNELPTTKDFVTAGWTHTSAYTATGLAISHPISPAIPSVISGQTVQICGISQQAGGFLMNKTNKQVSACLNGIFQDYKDYFSAYHLDDKIKVNLPGHTVVESPLRDFLNTYGQSYNHFVAQTKIKAINHFYDIGKSIKAESCGFYAKNTKELLSSAKQQIYADEKRVFQKEHNLNSKGQSLTPTCWVHSYTVCDRYGKSCTQIPYKPPEYNCDRIPYVPGKDSVVAVAINRMDQQADEEERNCRAKKDTTPLIFAKLLTAEGNFYLDRNDSRVLFDEIFEGVKGILLEYFIKNTKLTKIQNLKDSNITNGNKDDHKNKSNALAGQWATSATASSQYNDTTFAAANATGAPTLGVVGNIGVDVTGSWAESIADRNRLNTLTLTYDNYVYLSRIIVRESFNAGTISKIEAFNGTAWKDIYSIAAGIETGGVKLGDEYSQLISDTTITLNHATTFLTNKIRITTGEMGVVEYNEIDAVKLISQKGDKLAQWMTTASASSQFDRSTFFATQATGAPTLGAVGSVAQDVGGAWAEAIDDRGKLNTIVLGYPQAVHILQIIVRESFHAGTISKVEAFDGTNWQTIYSKIGSTETGGIKTGDEDSSVVSDTKIILNTVLPFASDKIRITTGKVGVMTYNEIDAVKVIGIPGKGL